MITKITADIVPKLNINLVINSTCVLLHIRQISCFKIGERKGEIWNYCSVSGCCKRGQPYISSDNNNKGSVGLCIEIQRMWNLKCTIVPVIIGATGIVTRSLRKDLEAVPGKHSIDSLQKTAILGTAHTIRKVLQCEA